MLLVTGFATPILFILLCQVPFVNRVFDSINPYIIYPSFFGTYQVQPLQYLLGNAPTTGQAIYVVLFAILNIILTVVNYPSTQPNTWFEDAYQEIMAYVANRTGVIAFAVLPLVILFSGRNNILLWLTNWSHSTYMLLHRWVARIFAVQVIVHSIIELVLYIYMGSYEEELIQPYWIWGIVATVATCIMLLTSILLIRRSSYELFLILHILLAVSVIVGCWYHVEYLFQRKWGYELWLYAACAVWFFDRLLRVLRIARSGLRSATVVEISEHIVRVDIQDVEWSAYHSPIGKSLHAYAYFPTLNPYRPWENHPFSIIPNAMLHPHTNSPITTPSTPSTHSTTDPEKSTTTPTHPQPPSTHSGLTLYIRKSTTKGLTSHLRPTTTSTTTLPTLLDGPYPSTSAPAGPRQPDRILLIAGGIGITGVLPHLSFGTSFNTDTTVALYWSLKARDEGLARDLSPLLEDVHGTGRAEVVVSVGRRLEAEGVLEREAAAGRRRIRVVVCGPGGLCDRVRAGVVAVGRTGEGEKGKEDLTVWDLEVDAFSW